MISLKGFVRFCKVTDPSAFRLKMKRVFNRTVDINFTKKINWSHIVSEGLHEFLGIS